MRYIAPFIPFIIVCVISFIGLLSTAIKEDRKQREAERRRAEKAEAAARAKAEREAKKAEATAARAAEASHTPKRKRGRPRKVQLVPETPAPEAPTPVQESPDPDPVRPETVSAAPFKGNNMFAGQIVAFTGALKDMTRAEAIRAVEANGGRAYETMPAGTTLLVVGDKPGMGKMDKADKWIGQTRKITQEQFRCMLTAPLTVTPDQFAAAFAAESEE
ncbi:MAG: hypothetical protein IJN79_06050 [Clostridia bacterium]|nr:hypothetical protein [Clostridia bacterium]